MNFICRLICQRRNRQPEEDEGPEKTESVGNFKIAFCTWGKNDIHIHKTCLQSRKIKIFRGAQMVEPGAATTNFSSSNQGVADAITLLEQVPNSSQILSSIFCARYRKGHFNILDSAEGMKRIFSYDEPTGDIFDIAFSEKAKYVALLSSQSKGIDYHLFDYVNWKKLKAAKLEADPDPEKRIVGLSFDPEGKQIATLDFKGNLNISEVTTSSILLRTSVSPGTRPNLCHWNPVDSKALAITSANETLNFFDPIKQANLHVEDLPIHKSAITSMQWQKNGSLLATTSFDYTVKLFDIRRKTPVQTFYGFKPSSLESMLKVLEPRTGKVLYSFKQNPKQFLNSMCVVEKYHSPMKSLKEDSSFNGFQ